MILGEDFDDELQEFLWGTLPFAIDCPHTEDKFDDCVKGMAETFREFVNSLEGEE